MPIGETPTDPAPPAGFMGFIDGKCQMADGRWQMANSKCQMDKPVPSPFVGKVRVRDWHGLPFNCFLTTKGTKFYTKCTKVGGSKFYHQLRLAPDDYRYNKMQKPPLLMLAWGRLPRRVDVRPFRRSRGGSFLTTKGTKFFTKHTKGGVPQIVLSIKSVAPAVRSPILPIAI